MLGDTAVFKEGCHWRGLQIVKGLVPFSLSLSKLMDQNLSSQLFHTKHLPLFSLASNINIVISLYNSYAKMIQKHSK